MGNFGNAGGGGGPPFGDPKPPPELQYREPPPTPVRIPRSAPWEVPPPGAIAFFGQARTSITGPAAPPDVVATLAPQNTPAHFVGVIRELTFQINDVVATTQGNVTVAWPTKLALAPRLAERIADGLPPPAGHPPLDTKSWPRPEIAQPPWERQGQWFTDV